MSRLVVIVAKNLVSIAATFFCGSNIMFARLREQIDSYCK